MRSILWSHGWCLGSLWAACSEKTFWNLWNFTGTPSSGCGLPSLASLVEIDDLARVGVSQDGHHMSMAPSYLCMWCQWSLLVSNVARSSSIGSSVGGSH